MVAVDSNPAAAVRRRRRWRRALAAALAGAAAVLLPRPSSTFLAPRAAAAAATAAASASLGAAPALSAIAPPTAAAASPALPELPSILLAAQQQDNWLSEYEKYGPDTFYYVYIGTSIIIVIVVLYVLTKGWWEKRWLVEKINNQKLKFITREEECNANDRYDLARMYNQLEDFPAALAEFEEVEEDFDTIRPDLDPEDTLGALCSRAMLHNSKGFALQKLDPPRVAQARREFVRAVTYWPEYPEALLNIGRELIKRKRFDVATRTLNTALKWQPGSDVLQEAAEEARKGLEKLEMGDEDE